ncbi:alpha/beta-hydrolase [Lophium mytilinum]|uniref:Alpha/beta-hydrolase n=1 Tax=Lophium mytilinum TaxID=390894 RepID=A0A6A6QIK0_9PEZI|nr:alpha/beta-hydrolase [Lophium mytilinum]
MDYSRPLSISRRRHPKVHIAMVLIPGSNHTSAEHFSASPVLVNPGGPGGSGIDFARRSAKSLQALFGEDQDIIGFDPRGVGETWPKVDCFSFPSPKERLIASEPPSEQEVLQGRFNAMLFDISNPGLVNSSGNSLESLDVRWRAMSGLCKEKDDIYGENSILRHLSTPVVSRDMLSIVEAWDDWIEGSPPGSHPLERPYSHLKGQLSYWGGSYGSLLGETFAAIYPDRVGRMVLDAIVNADYYVTPIWVDALTDAENVLRSFFHYCHLSESSCAIYRSGDTPEDIRIRYSAIMDRLKAQTGVAVIHPQTHQPVVITYSHIRQFIFLSLYQPIRLFPLAAEVLDALYREEHSKLFNDYISLPEFQASLGKFCPCDDSVPAQGVNMYSHWEANMAIKCGDKRYILNETIPNLTTLFELLSANTTWGDVWMTWQVSCNGWNIQSADPPLPWDPDDYFFSIPHDKQVNTSNPILFLSSSYDPVCAIKGAVKMARRFAGAGFVEQKSIGHGTFSTASRCTMDVVRKYFKHLEIPDGSLEDGKWKTCEPDEWPWKPFQKDKWMQQFGGPQSEEREVLEAVGVRIEAFKDIQEVLARRNTVGY